MNTVSSRVKQLREENGLNKTEFAKKVGVNRTTITRYESGELKPTLGVMIEINRAFGVSLDWIAGLTANKEGDKK